MILGFSVRHGGVHGGWGAAAESGRAQGRVRAHDTVAAARARRDVRRRVRAAADSARAAARALTQRADPAPPSAATGPPPICTIYFITRRVDPSEGPESFRLTRTATLY